MVFDASKFVIEVEKNEWDFGRVKPGNYAAKLVHIIDLGSKEKEWEDKKTKEKYTYETKQIYVNFAMSAKLMKWDDAVEAEEKSEVTIWKVYTLSLSSGSNLYKDVKAGFGIEPKDKFNPFELIGKDLMVNVGVSKDWKWGVIDALSQMPDEMTTYKLDKVELNGSIIEEGLHNPDLEEAVLFGFAKTDLVNSKEYIALTGKEPEVKQQSIEDQDADIEKEIAKSKESQEIKTEEISKEEADGIFDGKDDKKMA